MAGAMRLWKENLHTSSLQLISSEIYMDKSTNFLLLNSNIGAGLSHCQSICCIIGMALNQSVEISNLSTVQLHIY
jgi:hypothetical protein